jgi:hypothetical protein
MKCRICYFMNKPFKVYIGIRSVNYDTNAMTVDYRCNNGHEWLEKERYVPRRDSK